MKIDIDNTFVRYGRLHLTRQEGFGSDTFHAPPAPLGFYAMPIRFQELFLVGSIEKTQPKQMGLPKKPDYGEEGFNEFDWEKWNITRRKRLKKIIHKFTMKNEHLIWHHLDAKQNVILDTYGCWVKTTVRDWKISLAKESVKLRAETLCTGWTVPESKGGKGLAEVRPKTGIYSKDHFEVFVDSKVY